MRNARRMMTLMVALAALSTGAVILTTHAADQVSPSSVAQPAAAGKAPAPTGGRRANLAPGDAANHAPANSAVTAPASIAAASGTTPAKSATPGAPQVPEESATIRDDPTLVPDSKQSADNSVSFPNDI